MKMKRILLLMLTISLFLVSKAQDPIAQWDFNENDGTVTVDAVDGVEGNFIGDATWSGEAHEGTAVTLDGDGDYVETVATDVIETLKTSDDIAFTAYFNTNTLAGQQHIVWLGTSTGNGWGPESEIHITIGHFGDFSAYGSTILTFYFGSGDIADADQVHMVVADPFGLDAGSWHHVAGVISDAGSDAAFGELYLDGALLEPLTPEETTYAQSNESAAAIDRSTWDGGVLIGVGGNKTQRFFNGNIDNVKVFAEYIDEAFVNNDMLAGANDVFQVASDQVVFPNPVAGSVLYLKNYAEVKSAQFYDANGRLVKSIAPNSAALHVGDLSEGIYLLKTTDLNGNVQSHRVLRN